MQAFALENFIYINEEKTSLDDLGNYLIKKEEYDEEEIKPGEGGKVLTNLIKKKYKEINNINEENNQEENVDNFFKYIQPINFANFKNSSQNIPKLLKSEFKKEQFNEG